jgi:peptidyl-prolyl cis-trans isomerase SurA
MQCFLTANLIAVCLAAQAPPQAAPPAQDSAKSNSANGSATQQGAKEPDDARLGLKLDTPAPELAAMPVARVGKEDITSHDIERVFKEWQFSNPGAFEAEYQQLLKQGMKDWEARRMLIDRRRQLRRDILESLIDRKLVIQAARQKAKDQKVWDSMLKEIDKLFQEDRLPHLLKIHNVKDEQELRQKFQRDGRSLDDIKEFYRQDFVKQQYVRSAIKDRIRPTYPQMLEYYHAHIKEFEAPAHVTWRELAVLVDEKTPKAAARRKAQEWWERLRRGEDFARIAAAESQGATAKKGGLWDKMRPNSYLVQAVNTALERVPTGRVSEVIEGERGFYIILVEERRAAGPRSFAEVAVQSKIQQAVGEELLEREYTNFLKKLRAKTPVITFFDSPNGDPQVQRASANMPAPR